MSSAITRYYLLCSVSLGGKSMMIDSIEGSLKSIISDAELAQFTKKVDGKTIIRETIIGGAAAADKIIVIS